MFYSRSKTAEVSLGCLCNQVELLCVLEVEVGSCSASRNLFRLFRIISVFKLNLHSFE